MDNTLWLAVSFLQGKDISCPPPPRSSERDNAYRLEVLYLPMYNTKHEVAIASPIRLDTCYITRQITIRCAHRNNQVRHVPRRPHRTKTYIQRRPSRRTSN